jgi:hypothetical protein
MPKYHIEEIRRLQKIVWTAVLVFMSLTQAPVYAGDVFEITIQIFLDKGYDSNVYYPPPGNIIKIRDGHCFKPFKVVLKNITSSTQSLNVDEANQGLGLITFDITDENGNNNVVTKKTEVGGESRYQGYNYINPGKIKEFEIMLTEREWSNAYKLVHQGATKLKARASYKNGSTVIYSDYYTIIFEQ